MKYRLEHVFGAHLIYNRFWPGGISAGEFVATARAPYTEKKKSMAALVHSGSVKSGDRESWSSARSIGSVKTTGSTSTGDQDSMTSETSGDNTGSTQQPSITTKKMIWKSGIWELNLPNASEAADMNLVHGRLFFLNLHASPPSFQPYEYQYGYINQHMTGLKIPDSFYHELATLISDHRLHYTLGLELLDFVSVTDVDGGYGKKERFCVEEVDPQRSRKAEIVEIPAVRELSWGFRQGLGYLEVGEIDVEVGMIRLI